MLTNAGEWPRNIVLIGSRAGYRRSILIWRPAPVSEALFSPLPGAENLMEHDPYRLIKEPVLQVLCLFGKTLQAEQARGIALVDGYFEVAG